MRVIAILTITAGLLSGCATYTEKKSPCVCNWQDINSEEKFA
ncbi:hypothetical protein [Phaeobacter inhibens]|nr:hypothetical protein [Phaeobacter inhibens]